MGVDFYSCSNCGDTFPDCGPYANCETCGQMLCPGCMRTLGIGHNISDIANDVPENREQDGDYDQCPFCAAVIVSDSDLLVFALNELHMTKDDLIAKFKTQS